MADEIGGTPQEYVKKSPREILRAELERHNFRYTQIALKYAKDTSPAEEEAIQRQIENEIIVNQGPGWEIVVRSLENMLSMSGAFVPVKKELLARRYPELKKLYLMAYELSANDDSESLTDTITARFIELLQDKNILKEKFGTAESTVYTAFESVYATGRDMRKPLLNSIEEQGFLQEQTSLHHKSEPRGHAPSPMLDNVPADTMPEPIFKYDENAIAPDIRTYIESKPMKQAIAQLPVEEVSHVPPVVPTEMSPSIPAFVNGAEMEQLLKKLADESK